MNPEIEEAIFTEFPQLETERLILRQVVMPDRAAIFRIYSDPAVTRYNAITQCRTISDAERLIKALEDQYAARHGLWWGITLRERGTVIGTIGYFNLVHHGPFALYSQCATIGYGMARTYWRQGYTREAITEILRFGFETMQLNRVESDILPGNTPPKKMLVSLGFRLEGVLRERGYWNGTYHDVQHFALLRREWSERG